MKNSLRSTEILMLSCLLMTAGCVKQSGDSSTADSLNLSSGATQSQIKLSMQIYDNSNLLVYNDANSSSSLVLKSGQSYSLVLTPSALVPGISYSLQLTQIDIANAAPQVISLHAGSNAISIPNQGDYSLKIIATAPSMITLSKFYNASVTCVHPTFTANSLDANGISVSAGAGRNLYNYSAAGVVAHANGQSPYKCAFDTTGSGIIDSAFQDCSSSLANAYVNYVANRNVAVIVKDACNTVYTVSKSVNLPYSVPAIGSQIVFIAGQVSAATGVAVGDSRVDGVTYLATNSGGNNIVQPNFANGNFTIKSAMNYGMSSSVKFGVTINLIGITGSVNPATASGTLNASAATIKSVTYSTDQAGDSKAAVSFAGTNCTLSNQDVKVVYTNGTPCSPGSVGTGKQVTVEVYGNYSCTGLSNSTGSINMAGSFDGLTTLVDSCNGGGGGGGGIVPISL